MEEHVGDEAPGLHAPPGVIDKWGGPWHRGVWTQIPHGHCIVDKHTDLSHRRREMCKRVSTNRHEWVHCKRLMVMWITDEIIGL